MKSTYTIEVKSNKSGVALGRDGRGRLKCIFNKVMANTFKAKTSVFGNPNSSNVRVVKK